MDRDLLEISKLPIETVLWERGIGNRGEKHPYLATYHTVFLRLRGRDGNTVLRIEILREKVDDGANSMVPNPHGPLELRHGVVEDYVPQMTPTLQSVTSQGACRTDTIAYSHWNRISGVVDVRDVLGRRLEDRVTR